MNNKKEKIFIAVAWPYANSPLHLGHISGTYLACDFFARYKRLTGAEVLMVSGSDSHGTPITVQAAKENITPEEVVNKYHPQLVDTFRKINTSFDLYTHTRTRNHREVVQEEFLKLLENGYLFEKETEQLFCTKCDKFLPDRYVEGECPHCHYENARGDQCDECGKLLDPTDLINPRCKTCSSTPELRKTIHFFFDLKKLEPQLKEWIDKQTHWRKQVQVFTANWLKEGLQARAFTRDLKDGIPVPWEKLPESIDKEKYKNKVIYVWFEAVTGYLSAAIEWEKINKDKGLLESQTGTDGQKVIVTAAGEHKKWEDFWKDPECKHYYFLGKDNIPFHSIIWPALLFAREDDLNLPYEVVASQFLTLEGKQFSKSRDWYISVDHIVSRYGVDAVRYYFAAGYPEAKDIDFTWKQFIDRVNNELVANLGNFIHRTLTFTHKNFDGDVPVGTCLDLSVQKHIDQAFAKVSRNLELNKFAPAMAAVLELSRFGNQYLNENEPWKIIKTNKEKAGETLYNCIQIINALKVLFYPFLPNAAEKLHKQLCLDGTVESGEWKFIEIESGHTFESPEILFPKIPPERLEEELALLEEKNSGDVGNCDSCSKYEGIIVGKILELEKHPTKAHLTVVKVKVHAELVEAQIVCGAKNLKIGQHVPVATVGAIVPATHGTDNEVKIKKSKFAGVESEGMLCSEAELGIGENEEEIYVLEENVKLGTKLTEVLES